MSRLRSSTRPGDRRAFTLFEFLIAMAIVGLILASVIPFIMSKRELSRRIQCGENLRVLRTAMKAYVDAFASYPRVKYDEQKNPNGWTAFTGVDDANPFAPNSTVQPNDVTASLWLLVREGYVSDTRYFLCPSAGGSPDQLHDSAGKVVPAKQRGNFRSGANLGYSMFCPFSSAPGFVWADTLRPECVLLADKSPGVADNRYDDVTRPASTGPQESFAPANSNNHRKAGQNVLYADGSVRWELTPYVGIGYVTESKDQNGNTIPAKPGDNIYTSLQQTPVPEGQSPPADGNGFFGRSIGPSWLYDSYLVPSDDE